MSALVAIPTVIADCGCGSAFTEAQWEDLQFVGLQMFDDNPDLPCLELRNCACGSTIGVWRNASGIICDENGLAITTGRRR